MSESIIRSIIRTATGHLRAGKLEFFAFNLRFTLEKLERTHGTYAIMAETTSPFCVGYVNA